MPVSRLMLLLEPHDDPFAVFTPPVAPVIVLLPKEILHGLEAGSAPVIHIFPF